MAALGLHCGVERGACVWAEQRADLLDTFDSEMQEWEEQLQDVQRKIEELYKEVKARRGAGENRAASGTGHAPLDFSLLPVEASSDYHVQTSCCGNGGEARSVHLCGEERGDLLARHADVLNYHGNYANGACSSEASCHHNGFLCPKKHQENRSHDITLDILNGYLDQGGFQHSLRNPAAPHVGSTVMHNIHCNQDGTKLAPGRMADVFAAELEEVENRNNRGFGLDGAPRHVSWKEPVSSKETSAEKSASKLSLRQREAPPPILIPNRSTHFPELLQQPDRKCSLIDRKCGSPSVLRKFGAMLQENEGKTLIEDGTVTTVISADPSKTPNTPVCQRKFAGGWPSTQRCPQDSDVPMAGGRAGGGRRPPPVAPARAGVQAWAGASQGLDLLVECRVVDGLLAGAQYQRKVQDNRCLGQDTNGLQDSMKWEEQQSPASYSVQQISHEPSPSPGRRSFSRPARPANQRPPSRWASHTPTAKIATPSGPMLRPPSPARKVKQSFSLYTETIIM